MEKLPSTMKWSKYTCLNQIPIDKKYKANDDGIFKITIIPGKKGEEDKIIETFIAEAISIVSINRDTIKEEEFVETSFVDYSTGKAKIIHKQIPSKSLTEKEGITELKKSGYTIQEQEEFKKFITSVKVNINTLDRKGIKNEETKRYNGTSKYGFTQDENEINFDNFIGIDNPILPDSGFEAFDKNMFKKKGTLQGYLDYIDWFSQGSECETAIKQNYAIGLTGITKAFLGSTVDNPIYAMVSPSSTGKGFLANQQQAQWGAVADDNTLIVSSGSSLAGLKAFKDRVNVGPVIIADGQDRMKDKKSSTEWGEWLYEHTNGCNTIKAQADRSISQYRYVWKCPLMIYFEKEDIAQQYDGKTTRIAIYKTGLKRATSTQSAGFISNKPIEVIDKRQRENYGWLAEAYVKAIRTYAQTHNIRTEFGELCRDYAIKMKKTTKDASLYALVQYTYNLLYNFRLLPSRWKEMTYEENMGMYDTNRIVSSDEEVYILLRDRILNQPINYISINDKIEKAEFEKREIENKKIRGRIDEKEYNGKTYKIAIIPTSTFQENIIDLQKRNDLDTIKVNTRNWIENGWMIPDTRNNASHTNTNITRYYDRNDSMNKTKESCYWIILDEIDETGKVQEEEAGSLAEENQNLINEINALKEEMKGKDRRIIEMWKEKAENAVPKIL